MPTAIFGAFTVCSAVMLGAVESNLVATRMTFKVLEQERLAVVFGFAISTTVLNLLHLVPEPRFDYFIVVVFILLTFVDHATYIERIVQHLFPLCCTNDHRFFGATA